MEAIIDQLSAKVQELQAVQSQNQLLQRSRSELQSTLAERARFLSLIASCSIMQC